MDWTDGPATWRQLKSLKQLGYNLERRLTKGEATELIRSLGGNPEEAEPLVRNLPPELAQPTAFHLRTRAEKARKAITDAGRNHDERLRHELDLVLVERQDFWVNTCHDPGMGQQTSIHIHELYQKHGCRFATPTRKDVQYILDALDSAMPFWDRDHPQLFYQTLELNFPSLLRHPAGLKG